MKLENIYPFVRQGLIARLDPGKYFSTKLKTRDCRLFYILAGTGTIRILEADYPIAPGTVILFQAGTEYTWLIEELRFMTINFDYTFDNSHIRRTFSPMHAEHFPADNFSQPISFENAPELNQPIVLQDATALEGTIKHLAMESHMKGDFCDDYLSSLLKALIINIVRLKREPQITGNSKSAQLVRSTIEYIQSNFYRDIDNQAIAAYFHFNAAYINRVFKTYTGTTLHAFLMDYRLNYAMELLRTQDTSIGDISRAAGFTDLAHFTKSFKERTGKTPSEYRKQ